MDKGIEILQLENMQFYNSAVDRRVKKKKKWVVLFTKLVLTTELAKVLINTREAVEEAKWRIKNTRQQHRKEKKEIVIVT